MRRAIGYSFVAAMMCGAAILLPACSDDSTPLWEEEVIAGAPAEGEMLGIAFSASRGLAAGTDAQAALPTGYGPFLAALQSDGTWAPASGPTLPAGSVLTAVGFTPPGDAVVAGADLSTNGGFLLVERGGWSRHDVEVGVLAFAGNGTAVRAAGAGSDHMVLVSTSGDTWTPEYLPFPATDNERGLADIATRNGVWAACGFDDGAEGTPESPHNVLFLRTGSSWERVDTPCGGCSNREFKAVAVAANGSVLLGGAITDFGNGGSGYTAFLLLRSAGGEWTEIVLPEAQAVLDRVDDILIASNGDTYLACGVADASIVRWPAGGAPSRETTLSSSRIFRLAEAPDGAIRAAGYVLTSSAVETSRPAIWKRTR